jgi:hypothetical protein
LRKGDDRRVHSKPRLTSLWFVDDSSDLIDRKIGFRNQDRNVVRGRTFEIASKKSGACGQRSVLPGYLVREPNAGR